MLRGMPQCPQIRKHENPEIIFNCFTRFDEILFSLQVLLPGFCKHTSMVCFVCSYSVCFVGEWYHFSLFLPAFCFFLSYFFFVNSIGWHDSNQFPTPRESPEIPLLQPDSDVEFCCPFTRGQVSKPSKNTMNSILVPRIPLGEILRIGFWYGCDFFGYGSDERHHWSRQKEVAFVVHVAL